MPVRCPLVILVGGQSTASATQTSGGGQPAESTCPVFTWLVLLLQGHGVQGRGQGGILKE